MKILIWHNTAVSFFNRVSVAAVWLAQVRVCQIKKMSYFLDLDPLC